MLAFVIVWFRKQWKRAEDRTSPGMDRVLGIGFSLLAVPYAVEAIAWRRPLYFILDAGFAGISFLWFWRGRRAHARLNGQQR